MTTVNVLPHRDRFKQGPQAYAFLPERAVWQHWKRMDPRAFLRFMVRAPIDRADGPEWAAPEKHRHRIHPRFLASGLSARDRISSGFHGENKGRCE